MKKILPIVSLVIIFALAITTVVLAIVPKSYAPSYVKPDYIVAYIKGSNETFDESSDYSKTIYNDILVKFDAAFEESSINSLLQGRLSTKSEIEYNSTNTTPTTGSSEKIYLKFCYNAEKTITVSEDKTFVYTAMVAEVSSVDGLETIKIGLMGPSKSYYNYYFNTIANLSELNTYLTELELA